MEVPIDTLNVLVPFAVIGFIVTMGVVGYYSYKFGGVVTKKLLDRFFGRRE